MKTRTISAIVLLLVLIMSLVINSHLFGLLMAIVSLIGFNELFDIKYGNKKELLVIKILGMISLFVLVLNNTFYEIDVRSTILLPILLLTLPIVFYKDNKLYNINDTFYVIGIVYFLGFSFQNIIYLADISLSRCIFIFVISFITDTYAYIGGVLIGRHKLTTISPKKTVEGFIVGTVMGVIVGSVYYYNIVGGVTILETLGLCILLTFISEIGDLLFSSIKRYFDKKDYSNLIPGHGGILDRFDSVIYVSLVYLLILSIF